VGPGYIPRSSSPVLLFLEFFLAEFFPDFFAERCLLRQGWVPRLALLVDVVASSSCAGEQAQSAAAGREWQYEIDPAELTRFLAVGTRR
jgi:hypothetical protein